MTDPKNPCDPRSKKISQAPPPITRLTGGSPPRLRPPQITPKGMEWIKDFIEENEDARQQLYDGDITAFERFRDGQLWLIEKDKWGGDDQFWDFARRTGHVRVTEGSTAPLFIKQGVEQPDAATVSPNKGEGAEAPGTITGGVRSTVEGAAKRASLKTDIEAKYAERVTECRARTRRRPTFEADNEWRESKGLTYKRLRKLRKQHCTEKEKEGGRPPRS